jgi:hypothetical protein
MAGRRSPFDENGMSLDQFKASSASSVGCMLVVGLRLPLAALVSWTMYPVGSLRITRGTPKVYASSALGRRHFCADCGTGLFYFNESMLPGLVDVQSATCDHPHAVPASAHIQVAERIRWMKAAHELPMFDRFPPMS